MNKIYVDDIADQKEIKKKRLNFDKTKITGKALEDLTEFIIARSNIVIQKLDLGENNEITDNDCINSIYNLIKADKKLKIISFHKCKSITKIGLKAIIKALKSNHHL